jgi:hypothetical protein
MRKTPEGQGFSSFPGSTKPGGMSGTCRHGPERAGSAITPQITPQRSGNDPRLTAVNDAWDRIPEAIRAAIFAMIQATAQDAQ